jgi:ATP-dependent RNA helicase DDX23/PRP28
MSSSYDRSRSPVRRNDFDRRGDDKYSRGYDRRDNRRYESRRDREENDRRREDREEDDRRRQDRREDDRRRENNHRQEVPDEDIQMKVPDAKKRVPISIEELIQKKEEEKKMTEKVTRLTSICISLLLIMCTIAQIFN